MNTGRMVEVMIATIMIDADRELVLYTTGTR